MLLKRAMRMTDESSNPRPVIDVQQTLIALLVRELRRVYDHVDVYPAVPGASSPTEPENLPRIVVRWHDNAPLARIVLAPNELTVELGPRRSTGWKRVARVRYPAPNAIERILELVGTAEPGIY
jgi:hypothetical protein